MNLLEFPGPFDQHNKEKERKNIFFYKKKTRILKKGYESDPGKKKKNPEII